MILGKIVGAVAGATLGVWLGSWLGAVLLIAIGLIAGHLYDGLSLPPPKSLEAEPLRREEIEAEVDHSARERFARHLCTVFVEVARSDGEVVRDEIRSVREFFQHELSYSPEELEQVRVSIRHALEQPADLRAALKACREEIPVTQHLLLLSALYELALSDGALKRSEQEALRQVASALSVSEEEHRSIAALHLGTAQKHFALLGLSGSASDSEVKSAFRRLAAVHHPDKVAHLGAGAAARAERQFRELKDAYEEIRRLRGF